MAGSDPSTSAANRSQGEASTSEQQLGEDVKEFVRLQTEFYKQLEEVKDKPLRIRQVKVLGLERTKRAVVERELECLTSANTFGELRELLQDCFLSLENLDIFSAVNIKADEAAEGHPDLCDVIIQVAEKKRLGLHVGGFVQGTEGAAEITANLTNPLGYAENLQISAEVGHQSYSEFAFRIARPRINAKPVNLELTLHQKNRNNEKWSSYKEQTRGGILSLLSEDGKHTLSYELAWMNLTDPSRFASPSVKHQLGHSLKSALRYIWRHDTFDDPIWPTRGFGIRSVSEIAGLWPDPKVLRFGKQEVHAQWVAALSKEAVLALQVSGGLMLPWGPDYWQRATTISERFISGGISADMRGFFWKGLGITDLRTKPPTMAQSQVQNGEDTETSPQRTRDYLGGDLYCSLLAALRFKLPWAKPLYDAGIYGQLFVNGCNNVLLSGQGREPRQILTDFRESFRWSAGISLVYPMQVGTLELGLVRVLKSRQYDGWRNGIHVGFAARPV